MTIDPFNSATLAILLLFVGKALTQRVAWLRRHSIPDPVAGGVMCAAVVCVLFYAAGTRVQFSLDSRELMLLYFFAAIGLGTDVRTLREGGRPLAILLALAIVFIVLQNLAGMMLAGSFGMDARAGLMVGSISLTGGAGTTLAWSPYFTDVLGIANAQEVGLSANMIGTIAACCIGGPIASYLMKRHHIQPSSVTELEVGAMHKEESIIRIDYYGVLLAVFWLNLCILLGQSISGAIRLTGLNLPDFVGCLMAGILIRSLGDVISPIHKRIWQSRIWHWPSMQPGVALISDICLGLFLTMALMGLQLWTLQGMLGFIGLALLLQTLLTVAFTVLLVFPLMGRDYEATVISAGFGGITLGSTATAIANMSAVTRSYGAAPHAFLVVPLVCGFFIDLVNALIVGVLAR
ncbi:sodium/glutamate symporter [Corticibacter populi]|uniref:Sodium/glutamate symporter n=1 Tax=Corticibacter populi TaxID=1550736 RepID=A0A3M6R104_9BURK|nr:sodium/glutamate symporter [Corticibacter populi]